ncbi:DUF2235 domain-containing protein [Edwardsiella piscicida]|uniref:T6SS Phospholipase effector Tle1-like catalytic domain-containing protein n=3 Tax=Edwardsiella TaxID=635 RepID=A0A0H3DPB7_EDWTF|nr:DUF2235 domain-containing protein [Edwardsiella piscicida]ACY84057.1 hypothetical protein ETAE_1214 [Edwardsiella tarda EIB202]ADM41243.1 hypothetical protein ETAF_1128 [Edwardsiella tarda FL6-60]BAU80409.1 hypothetical protein SAMD00131843_00060 [Edwardsiella tarda]ARD17202.1 hypothetical protein BXA22_01990 [Edwardsiella piscicida]EKS7791914.1 DUF2235 domain-containing protein [Edwardsiella piscicida]
MDKRIVICCDGTGNELNRTMSNVLKFYRILEKNTQQQVLYTPGVGTLGLDNPWQRFKQQCRLLLGLGTGYGLDNDVLKAYDFLCQNWHEGDKIYLLGFSRGAYTVRVLAALIETIGIIAPEQSNLAEYGLTAYKKASGDGVATAPDDGLEDAWLFGRIAGGRPARIEFIGVWDTVSSVIVPHRDCLLPKIQTLRFTRTNKAVKCFRQAISIDERRRMFRLNRWIDPQPYRPIPYRKESEIAQDIQQVWFAGVHADVGGGYPESESGLSKYPLIWMLEEAQKAGLTYDEETRRTISMGGKMRLGGEIFVPPDATGILHRSLKGLWWILEFIPKNKRWREWRTSRPAFLGRYLPLGEPRAIPAGSLIHASVRERMAKDPLYRPINLHDAYPFTDDIGSEP